MKSRFRTPLILVALVLLGASCAGESSAAAGGSGKPSKDAKMICSSDIRSGIKLALGVSETPKPTSTFTNRLYTCTYPLASGGPLVLKVKELDNDPAAKVFFDNRQKALGAGEAILGLDTVGAKAGFQTPDGTVLFVKDNMTLEIDAKALPAKVGPNAVSQTDFAYQVATNVLGCWTHD